MAESDDERRERQHREEMTMRAYDANPVQAGTELLPGTEDYKRKEKARAEAKREQQKK